MHRSANLNSMFLLKIFMLEIFLFLLFVPEHIYAEDPGDLYSLSAVLMDADTGRVLYEKEGNVQRPNASTTKVLTCIVALEKAKLLDQVTVSKRAAAQPDVQLGIHNTEQYYLKDLLYSMMLQSHNDSAAAIAEHVGGTLEGFAVLLNKKAREIGCEQTYFITPNGLDASDQGGSHHTTASDLARIMSYAIQNPTFLEIAQTRNYTFSELTGKRSFTLRNTNAFFDLQQGVLAGKTGFTAKAGYCYTCACKIDEKTFVIALLGCGWPGNKTYKWQDAKMLLRYGNENFKYKTIWESVKSTRMKVTDAASEDFLLDKEVYVEARPQLGNTKKSEVLLSERDLITYEYDLPDQVRAPIKEGMKLGMLNCYINNEIFDAIPVKAATDVKKVTFSWCAQLIFEKYFH